MMATDKEFYFSMIDCQSLEEIGDSIKKFELEVGGNNSCSVKIEFDDSSKMELGPTRAIQKNPKYYVKMTDHTGYEWNKMLEVK